MKSSIASNPSRSGFSRANRTASLRARALLEPMESRVLLSVAPSGNIDVANRTQIVGWAFDKDTPTTSITVQIKIDGVGSTVTASQTRNDLIPAIGSANHGFVFTVPTLAPGAHSIVVSAADSTTGTLKVIKSFTLTNPAPVGSVDTLSATTVSGWAFDADAGATPISIRIDNNGATGIPVAASNARSDLVAAVGSPNHGFAVSGTFGVVDVYAIDAPTGIAKLIGTNSVKATGHVDIFANNRIAGWAWTPDLGASPVGIEVDVDGAVFQTATANTSRPDVASITGSSSHGFDFTLNLLSPGAHKVQIFALDSASTSNAKILLKSGTLTNPPPKGVIEAASRTSVSGWAFDASAGGRAISVKIVVDGNVVTTVPANLARPDLVPSLGSKFHGYKANLALGAGPHLIQVVAVDNPSGTSTLIATKFINNRLPIGSLDSVNSAVIKGWAFDADAPNTPVNIVVVEDGVPFNPVAANVVRTDLARVLPNDAHAFVISTPTHLTGTHTIQVIAVDTFTGQHVVLGNRVFTNHAPRGAVDLFASTQIKGWAQDPDFPTVPVIMLLRVDGTVTQQINANIIRNDLTRFIGSPNHGFVFSFAALPAGNHFLEVFAVDPGSHVSTLIGSKTIHV